MKLFGIFITLFIIFSVVAFTCNMCSDASKVVQTEFSASAMLKKYEHFKDMSSAIDKKNADIIMYEQQIAEETDKFEKNQLKAELRGLIAMHNQLCSEYNSAMSKFNYRFTNVGDLPASNLEPLPREFKPYITKIKN